MSEEYRKKCYEIIATLRFAQLKVQEAQTAIGWAKAFDIINTDECQNLHMIQKSLSPSIQELQNAMDSIKKILK